MLILAADVGGTNLRAALITDDGKIVVQHTAPNPGGPAIDVMSTLVSLLRGVLLGAGERPAAVSLAVAGLIDADHGRVLVSPNIPGFRDTPIVAFVHEALGIPVFVENDASAAALGEQRFGAGRGVRHLLHVTLGTGIGGGIVVDHHLYRGAGGMAGEIGHMVIEPAGPVCGCGTRGCLEAVVSGVAFGRRAGVLAASGRAPILAAIVADRVADGEDLLEAARRGDTVAEAEIRHGGHVLGLGIGSAVNLLNPGAVTLSGGLLAMGDMLIDSLRAGMRSLAYGPASRTPVLLSTLGGDTGILGATAVALERLEPPFTGEL